jgi:hypothetical protein
MEPQVIHEVHKNFPGIIYYPDYNRLEITGRSIPEDPEMTYNLLDEWITNYFKTNRTLSVKIQLEYINSGSSRCLFTILEKLADYFRSGKQIKIKWFYDVDDEAMFDLGEHYRNKACLPLEIEKVGKIE